MKDEKFWDLVQTGRKVETQGRDRTCLGTSQPTLPPPLPPVPGGPRLSPEPEPTFAEVQLGVFGTFILSSQSTAKLGVPIVAQQ